MFFLSREKSEDVSGARWISCLRDSSERMLQCAPNSSIQCSGNLHRHTWSPLWPPYYLCLFIRSSRPPRKEDFHIIIRIPSPPIIEFLETPHDANIWLEIDSRRPILLPAACTTHCPLVSSPPPSSPPAVARCSASNRGCSHRLWTGCPLCSGKDRDEW